MKPLELKLGPDVIERLLPHRRPFLMVDRIVAFEPGDKPTLHAQRYVSANEAVFEGHFPGLHLWPGAFTVEGMGQTGNLVKILHDLSRGFTAELGGPDALFAALRNMELGYTLSAGYRPELSQGLLGVLARPDLPSRVGLFAQVNVKLLHPVFAGQRLDYTATMTHVVDNTVRWEVEAQVDGLIVAKGTLSAMSGLRLPAR